jgi:pseudouridine-5'-phosphate glycosidase
MAAVPVTFPLEIGPEVRDALSRGQPVVALESTVIAHGLPYPRNLEAARMLESAVRHEGAVPAAVGLLEGRAIVGLSGEQVRILAGGEPSGSEVSLAESSSDGTRTTETDVAKVSLRDLGPVLAAGRPGATTVASTAHLAALAGIRVFATGGIGGVHRGGQTSLDVSADLPALSRTPIAVVCAGAKAILDLARTLEVLETLGVPVVGVQTDEFPAFYTRESGLPLEHRIDSAEEAARLLSAHWEVGLTTGVVLCNPPPAEAALASEDVETWIRRAEQEAEDSGITGKHLTPWLLARLARLSDGKTVETNLALLEDNARLAARVAVALSERTA